MIKKIYNNIKSYLVWKAAYKKLHEHKVLTLISNGNIKFETVQILRYRREQYRKVIAYQLSEKDGFTQHPDFYWHKTKTFSFKDFYRVK